MSTNTWVDELYENVVEIFILRFSTPPLVESELLVPIALRLGNENLFPASLSNVIVKPLYIKGFNEFGLNLSSKVSPTIVSPALLPVLSGDDKTIPKLAKYAVFALSSLLAAQ